MSWNIRLPLIPCHGGVCGSCGLRSRMCHHVSGKWLCEVSKKVLWSQLQGWEGHEECWYWGGSVYPVCYGNYGRPVRKDLKGQDVDLWAWTVARWRYIEAWPQLLPNRSGHCAVGTQGCREMARGDREQLHHETEPSQVTLLLFTV
jgi:hypothetical protein